MTVTSAVARPYGIDRPDNMSDTSMLLYSNVKDAEDTLLVAGLERSSSSGTR